jgi:hypothetical protein
MTSLELLVRPFQTRNVAPPKRIVGAERTVDPVSVSIGSPGGNALVFHAWTVFEFQIKDDEFTYKEIDRKTQIKRIENPDDPSQFVEVEYIQEITLRNKLNPDDMRIYEIKIDDAVQ